MQGFVPCRRFHLFFSDHVHELNAGEKDAGAAKILEAEHRSGSAFNGSVIWLDDVVPYLTWRPAHTTIGFSRPALMASRAATFEPLLSMVTLSGAPLRSIACSKNLRAAALSRCTRSKKSTVSPALSTAQYRYFHTPFTLTYVSSMRQLLRPCAWSVGTLLQGGQQLDRPAVHGRVIDKNHTLGHHFLQIPKTQRLRAIPTNTKQNHIKWVMQALQDPCHQWIQYLSHRSPTLHCHCNESQKFLITTESQKIGHGEASLLRHAPSIQSPASLP